MARSENEFYSSIYLDADSKEKLFAIAEASGKSRSQVIRDLLQQAGQEDKVRMRALLEEMVDLLNAT